jgi:hypothetical protein
MSTPEEKQSPPNEPPLSPLRLGWLPFIKGVQTFLVPQPDDRPLDQFLALRDSALAQVQSKEFLDELDKEWERQKGKPGEELLRAVVMELKAFTLAQEVAHATAKDPAEKKIGSVISYPGRR